MTWYYSLSEDGSQMSIFDHQSELITTKTQDGEGWDFSDGHTPDVVKSVMQQRILSNNTSVATSYQITVLADLAASDIVERESPNTNTVTNKD